MPIGPQSAPATPADLLSASFLTPLITYAGKQSIYALNGGAGGSGVSELNNLTGIIDITSTDNSVDIVPTGQTINLSVPAPPPFPQHVATINALDGAVLLSSSDSSLTFANMGQTIDIQVNPIAVVESLNTLEGAVAITSPGATIGITINGQNIELESFGTAGVEELNGTSGAITLTSPNTSIAITVVGQNIELETVSGGPANILSGADIFITADEGLTSISPADVNILAKNGGGGNISLISQAGGVSQSGGIISLESQGGSGVGGLFGRISLTAQSGTDFSTGITTGGLVNITANTGLSVGSLCSIIRQNAASIQSFAGAIPAIPSANPGFQTIYGNQGISLTAGLPAILPQVPFTIYQYAPGGISLDSAVYTNQMYPYWDGLGTVPDLKISGRILPSSAYVVLEDVKSITMGSTGAITGVVSINGSSYPPSSGGSAAGPSGSIQYSDGAGGFQGNNGLLYNGTSKITDSTGNNFIDINETANANSIAIQSASQINLTGAGIVGLSSGDRIQMTSAIAMTVNIGSSYGIAGQVLMSDGTFTEWQNLPAGSAPFVDAYQIYVAPNGNDTTGTGSQQNPFLTIARAITKRATLSVVIEVSIILSSGTYTESFTLLRNTFLIGIPTGEQNQPCNVVGSIAMNTITNQVGISGLQITGLSTGTLDTVRCLGSGGTYSIYNCNITGTVGNAINFFEGTAFLTECRVTGATATYPAIDADAGSTVTIRDCTISNPTTNVASVITSTGTISIHNSIIQSLNTTSTVLQPIITFSSSTTAESIEITYSQIKYANILTDTGGAKCCIRFTNSNAVVKRMIYCLLFCEGAITGVGGQIQCIQQTGTGTVTLSYGNLLAGATAHHIDPTIIKTQLISVP
jgi:hypothetical protein